MKRIILYISMITLTLSCKSIEKMIEKGEYQKAYFYAIDQLAGEKNKKTKYVKALEKAHEQLNRKDLQTLAQLTNEPSVRSMEKMLSIYHKMNDRQERLIPLLPLVSKDGYRAEFKLSNFQDNITSLKRDIAEYYHQDALYLLSEAKRLNDKALAREAYYQARKSNGYIDGYSNNENIINEAYAMGQSFVLLISNDLHQSNSPTAFNNFFNVHRLNSKWIKYHTYKDLDSYDYTMVINQDQFFPGYHSENTNTYIESKEIEVGEIPVLDVNGNTVRDTAGNVIYTKEYMLVHAQIQEIYRIKNSKLVGSIYTYKGSTDQIIDRHPISINSKFEDYCSSFTGDKRALTRETKQKIQPICAGLPTDEEVYLLMMEEYGDVVYQYIKRNNIIQ